MRPPRTRAAASDSSTAALKPALPNQVQLRTPFDRAVPRCTSCASNGGPARRAQHGSSPPPPGGALFSGSCTPLASVAAMTDPAEPREPDYDAFLSYARSDEIFA